ncbi:MAG: DUF134 domain-containing protein [Desulfopila sp.]|nr:DUF134 domain-containing protein [Desulfopila sp.]
MPRPKLRRNIASPPSVEGFRPNISGKAEEIILSVEEFEAIRLSDFEGLDQAQAASHMGVSRQTFGRVLKAARYVLARALVKGLQLQVTGGCYQVKGHGHRHAGGSGRRRQRRFAEEDSSASPLFSGDADMKKNIKTPDQQNNRDTPPCEPDASQNRGNSQGQGQGFSSGKRKGCGRGRGKGGGRQS